MKVGTTSGGIARMGELNASNWKNRLTYMINGMVFALVFEHQDLVLQFSW